MGLFAPVPTISGARSCPRVLASPSRAVYRHGGAARWLTLQRRSRITVHEISRPRETRKLVPMCDSNASGADDKWCGSNPQKARRVRDVVIRIGRTPARSSVRSYWTARCSFCPTERLCRKRVRRVIGSEICVPGKRRYLAPVYTGLPIAGHH